MSEKKTNAEKSCVTARTTANASTKKLIEISNLIRGKQVEKARAALLRVIEGKEAVPFRRAKRDIAHKPGRMAAGKYPVKTCGYVLGLLDSVEANARQKGLAGNLLINRIIANKAGKTWHYGRQRRIKMKNSHLFIELTEKSEDKGNKTENIEKDRKNEKSRRSEKTEVKNERKKDTGSKD